MKMVGYTNRALRKIHLFGGGIIHIAKCLEVCNELSINFCSLERSLECGIHQQCQRNKPKCECAEKQMVGKKMDSNITKIDEKKIKAILKADYKRCREIEIKIKENPND